MAKWILSLVCLCFGPYMLQVELVDCYKLDWNFVATSKTLLSINSFSSYSTSYTTPQMIWKKINLHLICCLVSFCYQQIDFYRLAPTGMQLFMIDFLQLLTQYLTNTLPKWGTKWARLISFLGGLKRSEFARFATLIICFNVMLVISILNKDDYLNHN
jgi:hypothetical protein